MAALKVPTVTTGRREIDYPESDGKPMAETDVHRDEMADLIAMLKARYETADDVYVSGNLLLYYEEGNPSACVAPDVFVVFGVPGGRRRTYKLWLEQVPPTVVIEVTSRKTKQEDLRTKRELYARLGVAEYYLYDPTNEYLHPPLQGFQLQHGEYQERRPTDDGRFPSARLGLSLGLVNGRLALFETANGARLLRPAEVAHARVRAEALAQVERQRADAERQRADAERQRADAERQRAESERDRAEAERQRAEAAEAEIALLRARLRDVAGDRSP